MEDPRIVIAEIGIREQHKRMVEFLVKKVAPTITDPLLAHELLQLERDLVEKKRAHIVAINAVDNDLKRATARLRSTHPTSSA